MWEYQTIYRGNHETNLSNMSEFLNLKGKQGWELVQVISKPFRDDPFEFANHTFIFKRLINFKKNLEQEKFLANLGKGSTLTIKGNLKDQKGMEPYDLLMIYSNLDGEDCKRLCYSIDFLDEQDPRLSKSVYLANQGTKVDEIIKILNDEKN
tara:strand:- start:2048 stop:2503 length:456 start_codon:yes stop_codon:yes gene_type:complete